MLIACIANPIFINTMVVFIRLYWFEQRFTHMVKEAQRARRERTRSRTVSEAKRDTDLGRVEAGVNGRSITVLHHTTKPNGLTPHNTPGFAEKMNEKERLQHLSDSLGTSLGTSSDSGEFSLDPKARHTTEPSEEHFARPEQYDQDETARETDSEKIIAKRDMASHPPLMEDHDRGESNYESDGHWLGQNPALKRDIIFADEVTATDTKRERADGERVLGRLGSEHHIAFLEKQRNNKTTGTLRIPGPRDFDRGDKPQELDNDEDEDRLQASMTRNTYQTHAGRRKDSEDAIEMNGDDHPEKRGITLDVPDHPRHEQRMRQESDATSHTEPAKSRRFNLIAPMLNFRSKALGDSPTFMSALRSRTMSFTKSQDRDMSDPMPYLSWQPTIGRNSMFVDLTEEQREELGGIEYRSLKTLAIILVSYFIGFHLLGVVILVPWIVRSGTFGAIVDADGQSRVWWGIFTPASMFNDLGFTLTPDSMNSFETAILPLLLGSFLIIIGNTGFPCMLRFVIWTLSKIVPHGSGIWEELKFLLDHPRRCFTLMFPSRATWWLFWILVLLNGIDLVFFIILDLNDSVVTVLKPGFRVLNGWFQAASTRTAGFSCVDLAELHPAIQVSYLIMMYISVFPIAISVRRTNVYEEKSLGIWGGDEEEDEEGRSYVGQHLRRQLSFDLWYIFLGLFIIAICEGSRLQDNNAYAFTLFAVLFEIVSAYGTVGLSLGYPTINASFSAEFSNISKLVVMAMMIRGRHRGLPYALDRAILLPSENANIAEKVDTRRRSTQDDEGEDGPVGLPRHNTLSRRSNTEGLERRHTRRGSESSNMSKRSTDPALAAASSKPKRRLSTVLIAGLSAGPTTSRKFD